MGTNTADGDRASAEALDTPYLCAFINIYNRPPTERELSCDLSSLSAVQK